MAKLLIEVAETPAALAQGLMYRNELPKNQGMLFQVSKSLGSKLLGQKHLYPVRCCVFEQPK